MYAVIETGGKQVRVAEGDVVDVERVAGAETGSKVFFDRGADDRRRRGRSRSGRARRGGARGCGRLLCPTCERRRSSSSSSSAARATAGATDTGRTCSASGSRRSNGRPGLETPKRRSIEMAHKKGQGSSRNGRDSNPKNLGVKRYAGQERDRRDDHRSPARHPVLSRRERRSWQRRHAVRAGGRCGRVSQARPAWHAGQRSSSRLAACAGGESAYPMFWGARS